MLSGLAIAAAAVLLRVIGGFFARGLAIALGARDPAASVAAVLYAVIGGKSGVLAAAALPLLLLGIERARGRGGAAVAVATAMMFASHGRAAAIVDLTLAGGWALLRLTLSAGGWDARMATNLLIGGAVGTACGLALSLAISVAPAAMPAPSAAGAVAAGIAVAVAVLAMFGTRRGRAIRWFLAAWTVLVAGRAFGVPLSAFLLDIVAPMPDQKFVAAAMPSLVLASLLLAALAWSDARTHRRVVVAALVVAELACAAGLAPFSAPDTLDFVSDGAGPHARALALAPGESVTGVLPGAIVETGVARRLGVEIGTYLGAADGALEISLCADARCETGTAPLAGAADNAVLFATLPDDLPVRAGQALRWRAAHVGGTMPVAIWLAAAAEGRDLVGPAGPLTEMSAHVVLGYASGRRAFVPGAP